MRSPYRPLAELTSTELQRRAAEYRRMATTARVEATISSLNTLAVRFVILAARREIEEAAGRDRLGHPLDDWTQC
jgi:hypothetical protein